MTALAFRRSSLRDRLRTSTFLLPVAFGLALAGCAKPQSATDPTVTGAIVQPQTQDELDKALAYWGDQYTKDDKNRDVSLNYGAMLVRANRNDQAVAVLQKAVIYFPTDRDVLAAYGKALAANGDLSQALDAIQRAQTPDQPDWKLLSAQAAILDQLGRHDEARGLYSQALAIVPDEPSVLSNYGMSFALTGNLAQAETLLRKAIS